MSKNMIFLRVSSGSNKTYKVLKPFSVVDVRGPQVFQAFRRTEDVTVENETIGRLRLSATDAYVCIQRAPALQACTKAADGTSWPTPFYPQTAGEL